MTSIENPLLNYDMKNKEQSKSKKKQYEEKLKEYRIGAIDNIRLSFDKATEYLGKLSHDIDDISNYKMFILCLNNGLEILFKYMIGNRNEFMLYKDNKSDKIYDKFKKAKESNYPKLSIFLEINPGEDNLHTISFMESCKILCYVFQINGFDELFHSRCEELAKVRNSLTHYSATIRKIDIISFCYLLQTSIEWFNKEVEDHYLDLEILMGNKNSKLFVTPHNLITDIQRACYKVIETEILNNELCKLIIGFVIENSFGSLVEVEIDDYDEIVNLLLERRKENGKVRNDLKDKLVEKYNTMNLANMFVEKGIRAFPHEDAPDVMSRIDLSEFGYTEIIRMWPNEAEQKKNLYIEKSVYELKKKNSYYFEDEYEEEYF